MPTSTAIATITVDGRTVPIGQARNLLEVVRASGVDLPTFCYHSELSVHGACRLCVVDVKGRGVMASCSTPPEAGMEVVTRTEPLRRMRRTSVELLLAAHNTECPSCDRAAACELQDVARKVGVERVRFKPMGRDLPLDRTSAAVHRDPSKCILCGDCVRMCAEVQGVSALDFAHRGAATTVQPAFGRGLGEVDCVGCGQCARVCPTAALIPAPEIEPAWKLLTAPSTTAVAQIAPAVRVAIGERFGLPAGAETTGRMVAALRRLGFHKVYDTTFTADLTVWEEGAEFVRRLRSSDEGPLPLMTSCCPAWVKWVEQFRPDALPNLSSCRSPQGMFGGLARRLLPKALGIEAKDLAVVSIMPCTAKKAEAAREELRSEGRREIDHVLTTEELARMIDGAGIRLGDLEPEPFDQPFGMKTGAGLLFGASGGVAEAVLRYADAVLGDGARRDAVWGELRSVAGGSAAGAFRGPAAPGGQAGSGAAGPGTFGAATAGGGDGWEARGPGALRVASATIGGRTIRVGVVSGLRNAGQVLDDVEAGRLQLDIIEVMACPGGCVNGAGQPRPARGAVDSRTAAIHRADRCEHRQNSADNEEVGKLYKNTLGEPGSHTSHELLHTTYRPRRRIDDLDLLLTAGEPGGKLLTTVCLGTSCHLRGSQGVLRGLLDAVDAKGWAAQVDVRATFCLEQCASGPNCKIGKEVLTATTVDKAVAEIGAQLAARPQG
jgi:NADH-quinone oxidoreductase subunit G